MIPKLTAASLALLFAAVLAWRGPVARGQEPDAAPIRGRVSDTQGQAVSGAVITLRAAGSASALSTISAADGGFLFANVNARTDYELAAESDGLTSAMMLVRLSTPEEKLFLPLRVAPAIQFADVTARSGLEFTLRNGGVGKAEQPEIMVGGVAAFDFDNDGCTDLFFVNGAEFPSLEKTGPEYHNRLYRNQCDGTFVDVTQKAGVAGKGYNIGVGAGDYDNDGFPDLFVTGVNGNTLYHNNGDGTFRDVTAQAGLGGLDPKYGRMWAIAGGWFDYDNDGRLDLFVSNYVQWVPGSDACKLGGAAYFCHPRVYKGLPNQLFHNNGDGTFSDVSEASGIRASTGKAMGVAFGDFNGDGLMDVFVANDSVPNFLFCNLGGGKFKESAVEAGVAYVSQGSAVASMGADFRDYDDDGREDIAVDAMYFDGFPLFNNLGKPNFFADATISSGLAMATRKLTGWGMGLYDLDNDGKKDLFYATSHFPGSEPFVEDPAAIPNHVLHNLGNGFFKDVSALAGGDFQRPALYHGAAFGDFDNDGRVDVVVTAVNGRARLFRNISPGPAHWLALRLVGTKSNREGLGAAVKVTLPSGAAEYNRASTSVGYASSSEALVRFGLGPYDRAAEIQIRWPGGRVQVMKDVKANQVVVVKEE